MPNNKKNTKTRMLSVEETNAALEKEFAEQGSQAGDLPPTQGKSEAHDESLQSSSVVAEKAEEIVPDGTAVGSDGRPLLEPTGGSYFPDDSHETDKDANKFLIKTFRDSEKRLENPPLLLEDLRDLGMYGELSQDQNHITMSESYITICRVEIVLQHSSSYVISCMHWYR